MPTIYQVSFDGKSLNTTGLKFRIHIKSSENLEALIKIIKKWNGVYCKCKVCQYY